MSEEPDILHIDSDDHFLEIYKDFFEEKGLDSRTYSNGKRGFRAAKEYNPKVILLESVLESRDGYNLLTQLKKNGETNYIPVVLFSVLGKKKDLKKAKELGANGYLIKQHLKPDNVLTYLKENFIK